MATCFRGAAPFARSPFSRITAFQYRVTQPSPFATLRFFTSSTLRAASTKAKPSVAAPRPKAIPAAVAKTYQPKDKLSYVLRTLAEKGSETLLYSAPNQGAFRIVCYVAGLACFGAAASSYRFFFSDSKEARDRNGIASWVPLAFGFIAVFWACIGSWLVAAPLGVVRSISAVPKLGTQTTVALRIEIMRLPGMKDKVFYAMPPEVTADGSIAATTVEYAVARKAVVDSRMPRSDDPMLLKPFLAIGRWVSRSVYTIMIYTKMSVMREGFVKIRIRDEAVAKVDCAGEMFLDGLVLDKLIPIR
ncbi:hypothetical protein BFW01_g6588 [Lasiodiplodia theobromae]|nr:hypothetical protein BFW01_g6588 [Lasiodiplodia theobromae]